MSLPTTAGLTIGFDAKRAVNNNTGLGNYSRLLIESMARAYSGDRYLLYAPKMRENPRLAPVLAAPGVATRLPRHGALTSLWRVHGVTADLKADGVDLFHGLSNELPLNIAKAGIASVVTIHDLIFRHFPQYYKPVDRWIYDYKFSRAARAATRVIAISERTRADLVEIYGIDPGKIDIVYQGCDQSFGRAVSTEEIAAVRLRYGIDGPYIVAVGTVEHRKNQLLAVKALRGLPADVKLVIVGRRTAYAAEIDRYVGAHGLGGRVVWVTGAPMADLAPLYRGSLLSVYVSRYEGFGLPVIESLTAGTPVVIASGSCLEEAGGPSSPVVDPDDDEALAWQCRRLIDDEGLRAETARRGGEYVKRFDASGFTRRVRETYEKALAGHRQSG